MIGQAVSHYRVLRAIGGGGMGVVYEAEDTRLGRKVALKFLTEEHLLESTARERFGREARAASSLNHPNVCTIFDVGEHEGRPFIAMELLEGATLTNRIDGKAVGTDELLRWGIQVADALDATHTSGIVHRDIKPGNIFVTARGDAKVLDFGIARLAAAARPGPLEHEAETATSPSDLTRPGATPGTVAYMSPEQLLGQPVDSRTDLFSLGMVLYQMATGRSPFAGTTAHEVSSRILTVTPASPLLLNARLPEELGRVVMKCLEKDRELRYQSARELLADLKRVQRDRTGADRALPRTPAPRSWIGPGLAAAIFLAAAVGAGWWLLRARPQPSPARIVPFTTDGGHKVFPRLSPDGERVAYAWTGAADDSWDIYVKQVGPGAAPLRLTHHAAPDWAPAWSPDGSQIAFVRENEQGGALYLVPALGGQERKLADLDGPVWDREYLFVPRVSWSPDGSWLAVPQLQSNGPARIVRLDLDTLERTALTSPPEASKGDAWPEISPDGRAIAFVRESSSVWGSRDIWIQALGKGEARPLTHGRHDICCDIAWTAGGDEIVFSTSNAYAPSQAFRVSTSGARAPELVAGIGDGVYFVTARRDRLVFSRGQLKPAQIWRMPGRTAGVREREARVLIASSQQDYQPAYSSDGRRIAFTSTRAGGYGIWVCDADGANPVQLVTMPSDSASWSPDGLRIAFDSLASGSYDLYVVDAEGGAPKRLTDTPSSDNSPTFSSDGSQIYFTSDRSGRPEVWRMPAAGGPAVQLTRGGGDSPREMNGRELYFRRGGSIRRASLTGEGEVEVLRGHFAAALSPVGIYYVTRRWQTRLRRLEYGVNFLDFASGRSAVLATQSGAVSPHTLAVSPDGSWLLLDVRFTNESELMLVENFR